jgi:hypothetical protein
MYQMVRLKMHGFWAILYVWQEMVTSGHPFLAVGGLKDAPWAPVQEHVTPFNTAGHLPVARGGHSCSSPGTHKQSVTRSGGKIVLVLENSWAVPVKAPYSHRSTTLRCVFFNGAPPTFREF